MSNPNHVLRPSKATKSSLSALPLTDLEAPVPRRRMMLKGEMSKYEPPAGPERFRFIWRKGVFCMGNSSISATLQ